MNVRHWALLWSWVTSMPISRKLAGMVRGCCYRRSWTGVSLQMFPLVAWLLVPPIPIAVVMCAQNLMLIMPRCMLMLHPCCLQ